MRQICKSIIGYILNRFKGCWLALKQCDPLLYLLLSSLMLLSGCAQNEYVSSPYPFPANKPCPSGTTVSQYNDDFIWYCGALDKDNVEYVIYLLKASPSKKLIIDSLGGQTLPTIELARFINENDIDLYINGVCLSACAQWLMLAAKDLYLRPTSQIGMHDTQWATNLLIGESNVSTRLTMHAAEEKKFYQELSIPARVLWEPLATLSPRCIANRVEYKATGILKVQMDFTFVMPDENYIREIYPGTLRTPWPSENVINDVIKKLGNPFNITYSSVSNDVLIAIPDCSSKLRQ